MNILGIDSSGLVASVALMRDDILVGEYSIHNKLTHSQTLLPMIAQMLDVSGVDKHDLDAIAVSRGPGSFTGLRIGASTAKGLAQSLKIQIIPVSSLEGLAYNLMETHGLVCPIMDARRHQVYFGIYYIPGADDAAESGEDRKNEDNIRPVSLADEDALDIDEVVDKLKQMMDYRGETHVTFAGDGVPVYRDRIEELMGGAARFARSTMRYQRASSVAALGKIYASEGHGVDAADFAPTYLRVSQAERELANKSGADQ